ncbi:MAG: hypothetical protein EOP49_13765 [Sphingobacteriales bacterium]|nr:MAG: hypothetical protein EOP49_13765 [Sphingobacteriales bacterium]
MNKIFSIALAAVILASCNSEEKTQENQQSSAATTATLPVVDSGTGSAGASPVLTPVPNTTAAQQPAAAVGGAGAVNPAHGQPGHRCEIPVGAPLNSAPAAGAAGTAPTQSPMMSQPQAMPQAAPASSAGGGKPNPPHGQPGHDCAVPVGQPLKG